MTTFHNNKLADDYTATLLEDVAMKASARREINKFKKIRQNNTVIELSCTKLLIPFIAMTFGWSLSNSICEL